MRITVKFINNKSVDIDIDEKTLCSEVLRQIYTEYKALTGQYPVVLNVISQLVVDNARCSLSHLEQNLERPFMAVMPARIGDTLYVETPLTVDDDWTSWSLTRLGAAARLYHNCNPFGMAASAVSFVAIPAANRYGFNATASALGWLATGIGSVGNPVGSLLTLAAKQACTYSARAGQQYIPPDMLFGEDQSMKRLLCMSHVFADLVIEENVDAVCKNARVKALNERVRAALGLVAAEQQGDEIKEEHPASDKKSDAADHKTTQAEIDQLKVSHEGMKKTVGKVARQDISDFVQSRTKSSDRFHDGFFVEFQTFDEYWAYAVALRDKYAAADINISLKSILKEREGERWKTYAISISAPLSRRGVADVNDARLKIAIDLLAGVVADGGKFVLSYVKPGKYLGVFGRAWEYNVNGDPRTSPYHLEKQFSSSAIINSKARIASLTAGLAVGTPVSAPARTPANKCDHPAPMVHEFNQIRFFPASDKHAAEPRARDHRQQQAAAPQQPNQRAHVQPQDNPEQERPHPVQLADFFNVALQAHRNGGDRRAQIAAQQANRPRL